MQWRHQKISKEELFVGQSYRRMEDHKPWPGLALRQDFAKGKNLKPIVKKQRWCPRGRPWPRGHILKSLASKPQVLENCPVHGSRTALFLNRWNFAGKRQKPCRKSAKTFFLVSSSRHYLKKNFEDLYRLKKFFEDFCFWDRLKKNFEDLFFSESTWVCILGPWHWPREGRLSLVLASKFFCVLGLEPCVLDSTSVKKCKCLTWETCWVNWCNSITQTHQGRGPEGGTPSCQRLWESGG